MKTHAERSYEIMYKQLQAKLVDMSSDMYNRDMPEINLLCAVVVQAAIDHDKDYLVSENFERHCYLLKLHKQFVLSLFKRCWRIENSGVIWEYTQPLEEDDHAD